MYILVSLETIQVACPRVDLKLVWSCCDELPVKMSPFYSTYYDICISIHSKNDEFSFKLLVSNLI